MTAVGGLVWCSNGAMWRRERLRVGLYLFAGRRANGGSPMNGSMDFEDDAADSSMVKNLILPICKKLMSARDIRGPESLNISSLGGTGALKKHTMLKSDKMI